MVVCYKCIWSLHMTLVFIFILQIHRLRKTQFSSAVTYHVLQILRRGCFHSKRTPVRISGRYLLTLFYLISGASQIVWPFQYHYLGQELFSLHACVCLYASLFLSFCLSLCVSLSPLSLSLFLCVCFCVCVCVCVSLSLFLSLSACVCLSMCVCVSLSLSLSLSFFVCWSEM